jgi:hypothetical protein
MPASAGQLVISIAANSAAFKSEATKVEAIAKGMNKSITDSLSKVTGVPSSVTESIAKMRHESTEAKGAIALLGDETGVKLPRHLRSFVSSIPGVAPALSAAFSGIAVVGLGLVIFETGKKLVEFFKKAEEAPKKLEEGFNKLTLSARTSNDELRKSNDHIQDQINKLEHKPKNALADALDDARINADHLANSLQTDYDKVKALLKENEIGFFSGLATGQDSTADVQGNINNFLALRAEAAFKLSTATHDNDKSGIEEATKELDQLKKNAVAYAKKEIGDRTGIATVKDFSGTEGNVGSGTIQIDKSAGQKGNLAALRGFLGTVYDRDETQGLQDQHSGLTGKLGAAENKNATAPVDEFKNKINELKAQLAGSVELLNGSGEGTNAFAKAAAEADKTIAALNNTLAQHHKHLTASQELEIRGYYTKIEQNNASAKFNDALGKENRTIETRIADQKLLNDAIGKGREAQIQAQAQIEANRFKQEHPEATPGQLDGIRENAAEDLRSKDSGQSASNAAGIQQQIRDTQRLSDAQLQGADAVRQARLQVELDAAERRKAIPDEIDLIKQRSQAEESADLLKRVGSDLNRGSDRIKDLTEEIDLIHQLYGAEEQTYQVKEAIKAKTEEITRLEDQQLLAVGNARDGLKVFFDELRLKNQSTAESFKNLMDKITDGLNNSLASILSGQQASWAQLFQSIAKDLEELALKAAETRIAEALTGKGNNSNSSSSSSDSGGGFLSGLVGFIGKLFGGGDSGGGSSSSSGGGGGGATGDSYGGGFAVGGDVDAGKTYMVGERGPEMLTIGGKGHITPNDKAFGHGGVTHNYNINVVGANPVETEAAVRRGSQAAYAASMRDSSRAQQEKQARMPRSAR